MMFFFQGAGRKWVGFILSLALAVGSFALGYEVGHRTQPSESTSAPVATALPQHPFNSLTATHPYPLPSYGAPANATPEMKEFMENRTKLAMAFAELRNQATNGAPNSQSLAQFQQQNKALIDRQRVLSQAITAQQAKNPLPLPPPLRMPTNASPQMQAFLTTRDSLMRDQITFMNQHRLDDPATRQAAIQQWRKDNAARFVQFQQESQALSVAKSTPTNQPAPH